MKKIISICLVIMLALGLFAGCTASDKETPQLGVSAGMTDDLNTDKVDDDNTTENPHYINPQPNNPEEEDPEEENPKENETKEPEENPEPGSPADKEPAEKEPEEEREEQAPVEKDYSDYLTVVSYNIKSLQLDKDGVVEVLRKLDGDVVGLQEVDWYNINGDNSDQAEFLARKLGYPYFQFINCTGHYGTAILSRYPMKVTEHTYSNYVGSEVRKFGRAEVDVDGKTLIFYNTHLTTGTWEQTGIQFKELLNYVYKEKEPTVLLGDFNLSMVEMKKRVYPQLLFPLHGGMEMVHTLPAISWDNIFIKNIDEYYWDDTVGVGLKVLESDASDHNPIYSYVKIK